MGVPSTPPQNRSLQKHKHPHSRAHTRTRNLGGRCLPAKKFHLQVCGTLVEMKPTLCPSPHHQVTGFGRGRRSPEATFMPSSQGGSSACSLAQCLSQKGRLVPDRDPKRKSQGWLVVFPSSHLTTGPENTGTQEEQPKFFTWVFLKKGLGFLGLEANRKLAKPGVATVTLRTETLEDSCGDLDFNLPGDFFWPSAPRSWPPKKWQLGLGRLAQGGTVQDRPWMDNIHFGPVVGGLTANLNWYLA